MRGVGSAAVQSILAAREKGGAFEGLFDFLERIDIRALNKRACEALIASGALDACAIGPNCWRGSTWPTARCRRGRRRPSWDRRPSSVEVKPAWSGQRRSFPPSPSGSSRTDWRARRRPWASSSRAIPWTRYRDVVRAFDTCNTGNLKDRMGEPVELACVVTSVARQVSRRDGSEWGKITIEDFQGTAQVPGLQGHLAVLQGTLRQDASCC